MLSALNPAGTGPDRRPAVKIMGCSPHENSWFPPPRTRGAAERCGRSPGREARRQRRCALLALLIGPLVLPAGVAPVSRAAEPRVNPLSFDEETLAAGKAVFFEYCAGCHGRRADGRGREAVNLDPRPQNLRNVEFVAYLSDDRMFNSVAGGVRGTAMPAFELILDSQRIWQVITYIRSLTRGESLGLPNAIDHQPVPPGAGNPLAGDLAAIEAGRKNYLTYCASCHGPAADGKGIIAPNLVPAPRNLIKVVSFGEKPFIDYIDDARLYDSITNGVPGTSMQPWIRVLADEERWQIISYLRAEADKERAKADELY